ncbi:hypothetical protein BSKO_01827 [Bryopsis sp. KO-2023]|nr:hypothetical protein BSKO_01827 [Bryopsis sp. KO-2023]
MLVEADCWLSMMWKQEAIMDVQTMAVVADQLGSFPLVSKGRPECCSASPGRCMIQASCVCGNDEPQLPGLPTQTSFILPFGAKSATGRRPKMEDCDTVVEELLTVNVSFLPGENRIPLALKTHLEQQNATSNQPSWSEDALMSAYRNAKGDRRTSKSTFQYGAVFDGHGGWTVSSKLSERLHLVVKQMVSDLANSTGDGALTLAQIEAGIKRAFVLMDGELGDLARTVGSTGVVSLISAQHIIVANCGDSRAVLFRGRTACRLSRDHKPSQADEEERVKKAGGRIWDYNGRRVMGLLAMSRAFGDHCLRSYGIIAEPEVTIIERSPKDEFVILASDGLWDVISDMEACALAKRCFDRAQERGASKDTAARVAASVLMRAALDKGSNDNVTVVVVDLSP